MYPISRSSESIDNIVRQFPKVFADDLGLLKGTTGSIHIQSNAKPMFLKPQVEDELIRLQKQGIISPVTFSNWATPVVPVLKPDGSVRLCGDYKVTINPVIQLDSYPYHGWKTSLLNCQVALYFQSWIWHTPTNRH